MTELYRLQPEDYKTLEPKQFLVDVVDRPVLDADLDWNRAEISSDLAVLSECVQFDLEDLTCFEVVDDQFEAWGVTFHNAIALQPSNPAFPARSGVTVLMGAPKPGFLEARFQHPVSFVQGFVTSSRPATLSAYDEEGNLLSSAELPTTNMATSESSIAPNARLKISAANIHKVTLYAFNGQVTLDDFGFSF